MASQPNSKPPNREFLEVPSNNPLESKLDVRPRSKPQIGPVSKSSLLSRLQNFLPEMQQANVQLEQKMKDQPAEDFDIEHVDEAEEKPYIEMDLACGVLELRDAASLQAAERAMNGQELPMQAQNDSSDDSSDDDGDMDLEEDDAARPPSKQGMQGQGQSPAARKKHKAKRHGRPKIEVL